MIQLFATNISEDMAPSGTNMHHSPPRRSSPSPDIRESGGSKVDSCHTPEAQPPNPRKRLPPDQRPPQETPHLPLKRQKTIYLRGYHMPASIWDSLSKVWLTKRTLKEIDRRNTQFHEQENQQAIAEWKAKEGNWVEFLTRCSAGRLKEIQLFSRDGGPDLSDLRGYRKPGSPLCCAMNDTPRTNTEHTLTTINTGPHDRAFQQYLVDSGVYPHCYEYTDGRRAPAPDNLKEIKQRLAQRRRSLSRSIFSNEAYRKFFLAVARASKEVQVMHLVIPIIEGEITDARTVSGDIPFTNLDPLTDCGLVSGVPDIYFGARPEQLNRLVRDELSGQIVPSTQNDLPILPNFFVEVKGPDGSAAVAGRQAVYNGALGARGMHMLQSYSQDEPTYDNGAYTITSTYHDGQMRMYTSHLAQPNGSGSRPEYYLNQIGAWAMNGSAETFRQGATAFRNARDWAKEQRDNAIKLANETHGAQKASLKAKSSKTTHLQPETSTNELAMDLGDFYDKIAQFYEQIKGIHFSSPSAIKRANETHGAQQASPKAKRFKATHQQPETSTNVPEMDLGDFYDKIALFYEQIKGIHCPSPS